MNDTDTTAKVRTLACSMHHDCTQPVTHIDSKGWIFCTQHGIDRRSGGRPCRKLRPFEARRLERGEPVARY